MKKVLIEDLDNTQERKRAEKNCLQHTALLTLFSRSPEFPGRSSMAGLREGVGGQPNTLIYSVVVLQK